MKISSGRLVAHIKEDGEHQHYAFDDLLPVNADAHLRHAVVHDANCKRADDRADNLANAACSRRAADETGGDDVEFETEAALGNGPTEAPLNTFNVSTLKISNLVSISLGS
jgi:hypothetical protein